MATKLTTLSMEAILTFTQPNASLLFPKNPTNKLDCFQAFAQGQDHGQGQRVEGFFRVQAGDAEAGTVAAGQLFEVQVHHDLIRGSEGSV